MSTFSILSFLGGAAMVGVVLLFIVASVVLGLGIGGVARVAGWFAR